MAYNISNEYKRIIYSGDARNKLKLLFNNVELQDADRYCERMTVKSRIVPNGAKIFSLNNFISKEAELILHDIDTSIIQDQVSISIGTLVGNNYEYVPIGIFNIENQPTNDKNKTTIKLRDNSVKFDFNYNAQPLIEENGGSATKLQILQDICTQAGVTCNITSFIGYLDEIGIYDNTVTARKYIADIAEQAGKIATINRSGELIFIDLNNLTTWEIPIEIVEKYESGTKFKVGKVVYEDGIVRYETEDSNDDTLFLDGSNNYINGELIKEQASSSNNSYYLENTSENNLDYFELEGKTEQDNEPTPDYPSELVSVGIYDSETGKYGIEVKTTGKNLFDLETKEETLYGVTTNINHSEIVFNGTKSANSNTIAKTSIGTLKAGKYTFSYSKKSGAYTSLSDEFTLYAGSTKVVIISLKRETYTNSFTIDTDTEMFAQYWVNSGSSFNNYDIVFQLEENTQATDYEPYIGHTNLIVLDNPLRSIGDTKDLLYIKNGMLYVDRKIGSVVLDGSENWRYYSSAAPYGVTLTDNKDFNSDSADFKTNYFENKIWNQTTFVDYNSLVSSVKPKELRFRYADISTLADFKTWLSTHNTEVQYVLATPSLEELGVIEVPKTYEETTYIDISSNIDTNTYLQYRENKTQVEAILGETNQFDIDSLKTGKILGNPAIDSYDLIQIHDTYKDETYTTLATNDLVYTGVLINTFDTQIGEEAKEQNVFVNGEETFKKWARTKIDNVEGKLTLQAGEINKVNGKINSTTLQINSQGALLDVLANKSNIDIEYDSKGNPLNGEVREVTTTTGFKFNAEGMTIEDSSSNFKSLHRNTGVTYYDGTTIVGQYTKDGSKQKDLDLFGVYTYGKNSINEIPMFVAQLYTDGNGEEGFGHFYNRGD